MEYQPSLRVIEGELDGVCRRLHDTEDALLSCE